MRSHDNCNFWAEQKGSLAQAACVLPSFMAACKCQASLTQYSFTTDLADDTTEAAMTKFLNAVADYTKEITAAIQNPNIDDAMKGKFALFKDAMTHQNITMATASLANCRALQERIE